MKMTMTTAVKVKVKVKVQVRRSHPGSLQYVTLVSFRAREHRSAEGRTYFPRRMRQND